MLRNKNGRVNMIPNRYPLVCHSLDCPKANFEPFFTSASFTHSILLIIFHFCSLDLKINGILSKRSGL